MPKAKKKLLIKKTIGCCLLASSTLCFTGCSIFQRDTTATEYTVTTVDNIDNLEENGYYVQHGDIYYKLYIGSTSFSKGDSSTYVDSSRVAWFGKDYDKIPTMYKGDSIVFHTSAPFDEQFVIERFEDIGYTIGICNMAQLGSGRYSFSTDPESLDINIKSNAGQICQAGSTTAVLDRIGGTDLRSNNISRAGTVLGLSEGKTYKCDVYFGTNIQEYKLIADVRALVSMESVTLKDYIYTQSKTITFSFPSYFNSGYYYVNGYGLVRYIANGNSYSDNIDMNIPNVYLNDDGESLDSPDYTDFSDYTKDIREESFSLVSDEEVTVTISYEIPANNTDYETPVAKVIGEYNAYTLSHVSNGTLSGTFKLDSGDYTIQITNLAGRSYSYKVSRAVNEKTADDTSESAEVSTETTSESVEESETDTSSDNNSSELSIADQLKAVELEEKGE